MTDSSASVVPADDTPVKKRRALGVAALVLALLAILGDIVTIAIAVASGATFSDSLGAGAGLLAVFVGVGAISLVIGLVLAGISLILAIIALIVGSGRGPAVVALILSLGVIISHGIVFATIAALTSAFTGIGS